MRDRYESRACAQLPTSFDVARRAGLRLGDHVPAGVEHAAQFDGPLELVEVRGEVRIDGDLPDRRADGRKAHPFSVEKLFELPDLLVREHEDVGLVNRPELDEPDTAGVQYLDLADRVRVDLVGECGEGEHGGRPVAVPTS